MDVFLFGLWPVLVRWPHIMIPAFVVLVAGVGIAFSRIMSGLD